MPEYYSRQGRKRSGLYFLDERSAVVVYSSNIETYDADGIPDVIRTFTYDDRGNKLIQSDDYNDDGTPEAVTTYVYDSNNNRLSNTLDYDGDGLADLFWRNMLTGFNSMWLMGSATRIDHQPQ